MQGSQRVCMNRHVRPPMLCEGAMGRRREGGSQSETDTTLLVESGSVGGLPKAASKLKLHDSPRQVSTQAFRVCSAEFRGGVDLSPVRLPGSGILEILCSF